MRYLCFTIVSLVTVATIAFPTAPHAAAANTTLEAESMVVTPTSAARVITDFSANGGRALGLSMNSSAATNISLPASVSVVIRAKGTPCLGAPNMTVSIDGQAISATAVSARSWTNYTTASTISAGTHTLSIAFTNAYRAFFCTRSLLLDNVTVVGGAIAPPAPVPPSPPSAMQPTGVPGNWTIAFDDEFNGTTLDQSRWSTCWFSPGCGKMNNVTTSPSNLSVANGNLILNLASSSSGALVSTNPVGGATVGYQFTTGVVEARIYMPGSGTVCSNWPAFWTTGQSWPNTGENDIAEVLGGQMTVNYHSSSGAHNQGAIPGAWCGAYHVYTLNRQANSSDVYYDGQLVKSYLTDDKSAPQYVVINLGASSPSAYGAASQVAVDYVRVWQ